MAFTTDAEIRKIIDVSTEITDLSPFIDAASSMVTAHCTDITDANAAIVETWLAAHLITIRDNRVNSEAAGSVSQSFQFKVDLGLDCSMYGQTAIQLDTTGGLSAWNAQIKSGTAGRTVSVDWLGLSDT